MSSSGSTTNLLPVYPIFLTWEGLTVTAKRTKRLLLQDVTGIAQPGQLIALMGARFSIFCFFFHPNLFFYPNKVKLIIIKHLEK